MTEVPIYRCKLERAGSLHVPSATIGRTNVAVDALRTLIGDRDREHFAVLYLDRENLLIGAEITSIGTQDKVQLWVEHVFRGAVVSGCDKLIVAHNHGRAPATPSPEDRTLTKELAKCGKLLGLRVVDHIVLAVDGSYYSFHDKRAL